MASMHLTVFGMSAVKKQPAISKWPVARKVVRYLRGRYAALTTVSLEDSCRLVTVSEFAGSLGSSNLACVAQPAEFVRTDGASAWSAHPQSLSTAPGYQAESLRLAAINDAHFYGTSGYFKDHRGRLVRESISHWHPKVRERPVLFRKVRAQLGAPVIARGSGIEGACLLAASAFGKNYYHWHVDLLPGVALLEALAPATFRVLVDQNVEHVSTSLSLLGIDPRRIVCLPRDRAVTVEHLIVCSAQQNLGARMHPYVASILRNLKAGVPAIPQPLKPRLFVSRGENKRRPLVNREELEDRFETAGFEVVRPELLPYEDQIRLFDQAEMVVGEHGAALLNIGFCRPTTLVVEFFNPRKNDLCYQSLARLQGLAHAIFAGKDDSSAQGEARAWSVNPGEALAFVLSRPRPRASRVAV